MKPHQTKRFGKKNHILFRSRLIWATIRPICRRLRPSGFSRVQTMAHIFSLRLWSGQRMAFSLSVRERVTFVLGDRTRTCCTNNSDNNDNSNNITTIRSRYYNALLVFPAKKRFKSESQSVLNILFKYIWFKRLTKYSSVKYCVGCTAYFENRFKRV